MKIKLNSKQIEKIRRQLGETDRKQFDTSDVFEVFKMLQYWSRCIGGDEVKIKSVTELADGYLCRVNSKFREVMKAFLKQGRSHHSEKEIPDEDMTEKKEGILGNADRYERLIREAEEKQKRRQ
jgi:hypothetical protein